MALVRITQYTLPIDLVKITEDAIGGRYSQGQNNLHNDRKSHLDLEQGETTCLNFEELKHLSLRIVPYWSKMVVMGLSGSLI